jgi:hypothetical protein
VIARFGTPTAERTLTKPFCSLKKNEKHPAIGLAAETEQLYILDRPG